MDPRHSMAFVNSKIFTQKYEHKKLRELQQKQKPKHLPLYKQQQQQQQQQKQKHKLQHQQQQPQHLQKQQRGNFSKASPSILRITLCSFENDSTRHTESVHQHQKQPQQHQKQQQQQKQQEKQHHNTVSEALSLSPRRGDNNYSNYKNCKHKSYHTKLCIDNHKSKKLAIYRVIMKSGDSKSKNNSNRASRDRITSTEAHSVKGLNRLYLESGDSAWLDADELTLNSQNGTCKKSALSQRHNQCDDEQRLAEKKCHRHKGEQPEPAKRRQDAVQGNDSQPAAVALLQSILLLLTSVYHKATRFHNSRQAKCRHSNCYYSNTHCSTSARSFYTLFGAVQSCHQSQSQSPPQSQSLVSRLSGVNALFLMRIFLSLYLIITFAKSTAVAHEANSQQSRVDVNQINSSTTQIQSLALVLSGNSSLVRKTTTVVLESNTHFFVNESVKRRIDEFHEKGFNFSNTHIFNDHILMSRDNILKQQHQGQQQAYVTTAAGHIAAEGENSPCASCRLREKAKQDSLESIKMHILMRLHLSHLPNITTPKSVPHKIIEDFYKRYNNKASTARKRKKSLRRGSNSEDDFWKDENKSLLEEDYDGRADGDFGEAMQSDDPKSYGPIDKSTDASVKRFASSRDINDDHDEEVEDDNYSMDESFYYEDGGYSHVNNIYVFPKVVRFRHGRKSESLNFKLEKNKDTVIKKTILHLYVRGRDWMQEYEPELLSNVPVGKRHDIVVSIYRALRRSNAVDITHTHKLADVRCKIPPGLGQWTEINLKLLPMIWMENLNATQSILVKVGESWMRSFIVIDSEPGSDSNSLIAHIEIQTEKNKHNRRKRSTSLDCQESDHEVRCCRYPLKVNFTSFGWSFVVAPTDFEAYFCNGECKIGYLEQYTHTHLTSLTTSATPCCSPTKMSELSLLYFDMNQNLVLSTIPNMTVEKCSCS